jgi:hypothetical protein
MRKNGRICLTVFAAALVALALVQGIRQINAAAMRGVREEHRALEEQLNTHLPLGVDSTQVTSYLDSQSIDHAPYQRVGENKVLSSVFGAPAVIEARVPVHAFSPIKYSIHLILRFDNEGHFIGYSDKVEGTFY